MKETSINGVLKTETGALVASKKNNPAYEQHLKEKGIHLRVSSLESKLDNIENLLNRILINENNQ